jgi:hypothetical protein
MRVFVLWLIAAAGVVLTVLGLAAAANVISLRGLLATAEVWQLLRWTERVHALLNHRTVQLLELSVGFTGLGLVSIAGRRAVWVLRGRASTGYGQP